MTLEIAGGILIADIVKSVLFAAFIITLAFIVAKWDNGDGKTGF